MKVYTYIPPNNGKLSQSNNGNLSQEAKLILEDAWNIAKSQKKKRTTADDLLIAICNQPDSVAMKALTKLGVDALEIRQGIKNKIASCGI